MMRKTLCTILVAALFVAAQGAAAQSLESLLDGMPAEDQAAFDAACEGLLELGPEGVAELCAAILPDTESGDTNARFLLSGLAKYVSRDGEKERGWVSETLADALANTQNDGVKAFLMRRLQVCGGDEAVTELAFYLRHDTLHEPAAAALTAIGTETAAGALLETLPRVDGARQIAVLNALGAMDYAPAEDAVAALAQAEDAEVSQAAARALSRLGGPEHAEVFKQELETDSAYRNATFMGYYCQYLERLEETGHEDAALEAARELIEEEHLPWVRSAGLSLLVDIEEEDALPALTAAMDSDCAQYRGTALLLAQDLDGRGVTRAWVEALETATPQVQAEILYMLAHRDDRLAERAAIDASGSEHQVVRLAAIDAMSKFEGNRVAQALADALKSAENDDETAAIKASLLRTSARRMVNYIEDAIPELDAPKRVALLEVLAARRADEAYETVLEQTDAEAPEVRVAARKALAGVSTEDELPVLVSLVMEAQTDDETDAAQEAVVAVAGRLEGDAQALPVLAALPNAEGAARAALLETLPALPSDEALQAVVENTQSSDARVKEAAVAALAAWPEFDAVDAQLELARNTANLEHRVAAIQGYVRLVGAVNRLSAKKVLMLRDALAAAESPDAKRAVLNGLKRIGTVYALLTVGEMMDDEAVARPAAMAAMQMALPTKDNKTGLVAHPVAEVLEKALAEIEDEESKKRIQAHMDKMPKADEEGFAPMFNGEDLTGWTGNRRGYGVEGGAVFCKENTNFNLYSAKSYGDFVLRFAFKLTEGANNGIGIRVPMLERASKQGMEIQVIHNDAEKHQDIHDWQYHGSVYGVAPAKKLSLEPGVWHEQEIRAEGHHIVVTVNGTVVSDVDVAQIAESGAFADDKEHPGALNETGHISFCGHNTRVDFQDMRIKELP